MFLEKVNMLLRKKPQGTENFVHIDKVIITKKFKEKRPKEWKMLRCESEYLINGYLDSPVTLCEVKNSNKYILVDGYTRYLLAKRLGIKYIPVKYKYY